MKDEKQEERRAGKAPMIIGIIALLYLIAMGFVIWGFAIGRYEVWPAKEIQPMVDEVAAFFESVPEDDRDNMQKVLWHRQERPKRFDEGGFVQKDADFTDPGYLLNSYFDKEKDQVVIDLVRLSDFKTLHTWIPPVDEILERGRTDLNTNSPDGYRAQHPLLLEDGSILITSGESPLVKLDRDSKVEWIIDQHFHHSIERGPNGNFYIPIWMHPPGVQLDTPFRDDGYAVVSPEGEILEKVSVGQMLMENGYEGLLLGAGVFKPDRIHLNDAQPMHHDLGVAKKGDVGLSIRNLSTVALYRPSTGKIVWLKTGPWLYQHDVNQLPDGRFSIFGNDMFMTADKPVRNARISNVYIYDPVTDTVQTPYTEIFEEVHMISSTEGRSRVLENQDVYVEETNSNRLLRVSPEKVRWQFVNNQTDQTSGALHWCRYLEQDKVDLSWLAEEPATDTTQN